MQIDTLNRAVYCSLAHSNLASLRKVVSGSASFQSVRKFRYAVLALFLSPMSAKALPNCRYVSAPALSVKVVEVALVMTYYAASAIR